MRPRLARFLHADWDAIAGIVAAVVALVMHFLHLIEPEVLTMITLVLVALLFIRGLRSERSTERSLEQLQRLETAAHEIRGSIKAPDAVLVGPGALREASERFSRNASGEMVWFHVCLSMFRPQALFDALLRPAIENDRVTSIRFTLDEEQRELWETVVVPKLKACRGFEKVASPNWTKARENVSFISSGSSSLGTTECLLSFWGEPFMSTTIGRAVPRFIFHVQPQSQLVEELAELDRNSRLREPTS